MKLRAVVVAVFALTAAVVVGGGACTPAGSRAPAAPEAADDVRRLAAILDYVAADYAGAISDDGQVLSKLEYDEQVEFLSDAALLAGKLPADAGFDVTAALGKVAALVRAKARPAEVSEAARALRRRVLDGYGVVLAPATPPSQARGAELYAKNCVICHGATGGGDGPSAAKLDPPPRSFLDVDVMRDMSPARAFSALTDGLKNTAMASFAGALPAPDRWSLAFHVFTLRHDAAAATRGQAAYAQTEHAVSATATRLAGASDGDLLAKLGGAGLDEAAAQDALAWLRVSAPYQPSDAPLDPARRLLADALAAYRTGDTGRARQLAATAYIDGFDPYEGALGARDAALVGRIEDRFTALKQHMSAGASVEQIEQEQLQLGVLLDQAEEMLGGVRAGHGSRSVAFGSALVIVLREGVEAALLILLLLGLSRRAGAGADVRAVHVGWLAALGVGVGTWFLSAQLFTHLKGREREIVEGSVALLAAGVLLWAGHYVLARLDAKRRVDALKQRFVGLSAAGRRWALASLAFLAVFREAFEVVLFLRTVEMEYPQAGQATVGGAAAGGVFLVAFVLLLQRLGKRVKPGPLLTASGTLLCALAVILAGKGVRSLQEADVLAQRRLALPRIDWLGVFPTLEGVLAQVVVLVAFVGIAVVAVRRSRLA